MPIAPPTGTVTFLFSDIEGSTMRWEEDRQAMNAALQRHDALLRRAVEAHGGYVFKTVGDEFCCAFSAPQDALAAALDAQRALAAADFANVGGIRVRMALHAGTAEERGGDYFGPEVNRVARLLSAGHGAQVLTSAAVAELLDGRLPAQAALRDLGPHRLRDLSSEHIFQLVAAELPDDFPALRSVDTIANNLPAQLTPLVGREDAVNEIEALLQRERLITLTGVGGAGKTRCAIQVGAEALASFDDGVWFVELAPISDASLVAATIAQTLNVQTMPNKPSLDTVLHYLRFKRLLLILDNCEHVIGEARAVAVALVHGCENVRLLTTSRERLNVAGEVVYRMPSLAVPAAAELFAARASASDGRFHMTPENAPVVADICRRVDGIPLAIELAAARITVLSPAKLLEKLDDRFRVLTGGDRAALPRQQTMRALIDWSYDLLSGEERALFRKLSIFAGGFTLETARAVGDGDELAVLEVLSSLVDKSLVQVDPDAAEMRYRLLESTRQYAREKLAECGEESAVARAHAEALLALARSIEDLNTVPDREWFAKGEPELDNWRAALEWTLGARNDVALGQRLVAATRRTWSNIAVAEGARWLRVAQENLTDATPAELIAALDQTESQLSGVLGLHKASLEAAERALQRCRELRDSAGIAKAQRQIGRALVLAGQPSEGEPVLRDALAVFRRSNDRALIGATLENLAIARGAAGDIARAREYFSEALTTFKAIGAERLASAVANNLAESEFHAGNPAESLRLAEDALASDTTAGVARRRALLLSNIAAYLIALGRYDEAQVRARDALAMARGLDYAAVITWAMQHLAAVAAAQGKETTAAQLLGFVDARIDALQMTREYTEQREYDATLNILRETAGEDALAPFFEEGRGWSEDQAAAQVFR